MATSPATSEHGRVGVAHLTCITHHRSQFNRDTSVTQKCSYSVPYTDPSSASTRGHPRMHFATQGWSAIQTPAAIGTTLIRAQNSPAGSANILRQLRSQPLQGFQRPRGRRVGRANIPSASNELSARCFSTSETTIVPDPFAPQG
jgi:hypothetical protein